MATPSKRPQTDISTELEEAVKCEQWGEVLRLIGIDGCSDAQRRWAISDIVQRAPEKFVEDKLGDICDTCADGNLGGVLSHLVTRRLGRLVGPVLRRDVNHTQHWLAVEWGEKSTVDASFVDYILPHCLDEELDAVITHLVSRGLWWSVDKVLGRGVSSTQHRWAVEEALNKAEETQFANHILPHCAEEELGHVLSCMVSRGLWEPIDRDTDSNISVSQHVFSQLVSHGLWSAVDRFFQQGISSATHRWAVEQASKHANDEIFVWYILPHCHDEELNSVITHLVSRCLWQSVNMVLERGVSSTQHRWAVEQASKHAGDYAFAHCITCHCHDEELDAVITHLVSRGLWCSVDKVLERGVSSTQHRWAVEEALKKAEEKQFANHILPHYAEEELGHVLSCMVSRGLWEPIDCDTDSNISVSQHVFFQLVSHGLWSAVDRFYQQSISSATHRWAVEQASKHTNDQEFVQYILPHCHDEELNSVITHLVSQCLWKSVNKVLERGVSSTQHRWAVEQASKHTDDQEFVWYILPHCHDEELDSVITDLVSRSLWKSVNKVLERGVSSTKHRWAVKQASKHTDYQEFVWYILPHCHDEELNSVITHLVSQCLWQSVNKVLQRGVSSTQHRWAVEQASKHTNGQQFVQYILPHCHDEELNSVITHLVTRALWWSVDKVLQRGVSSTQHRWAVEEALKKAEEKQFANHILPHYTEEELEHVLSCMVSRGLWEPIDCDTDSNISVSQHVFSQLVSHGLWSAVDRFYQQGISSATHRWAVEQASKHANDQEFVQYILPHCHDEELDSVITHLVSQCLWKSVNKVLERGVSSTQHRWAVEQASRHASDDCFANNMSPHCLEEGLESIITHLVLQGLVKSIVKMLERCVGSAQHRLFVEEAAKNGDDSGFHRYILRHCSEDEVVTVFPLLVASKKWRCTQHVLWVMVRDTLRTWITSEHESSIDDIVFWKFIYNCHVDVSQVLSLTKAVTKQIQHKDDSDLLCRENCSDVSSALARSVSWKRPLCESMMTSLLHILCNVVCNDNREYLNSKEHTKQHVSDIHALITACVRENRHYFKDNRLRTIENKEKWTPKFAELAGIHKNDDLLLLHFLQGLNLYHISRQGEYDDNILLVILAVFPLFPQPQSVVLRMMLHEKRWEIISQACLSHVWEHDRQRLFKAAVMQRRWDVVRQWCDHTVHDDQRHWALTEAFKEKQWEVYLLLADHGLTPAEQMYAHYMVAKEGSWSTVLHMVERGGDITEVSDLLENWVTGNLRKKPQGDVKVYEERCIKLIKLRLFFAKRSAHSPMKALERCKWGSVLFNILHKPTEYYFSRVLEKVIEEEAWHILMHLVRLGMNSADRDRLFPDMLRRQQWGVCRMLLEYGVNEQLCLEALPELMERNQWSLVARVMEYEVDDAVRCQVMHLAFQRRAGALFWHCLLTMENKEHMSKETQRKLFHQAISHDIWHAVKPLVGEKGDLDIQCRDMAFLEAIELHLWDVVDYCQRLGADINMKDENGETPLHREARKREWKAVEEIVFRDGQPNLLDKDGFSVLNRLIQHKQWAIVKMVITYGGDIHLSARYTEYGLRRNATHTPLQALIDARQADIIHFSLMWCGDQKKGVNERGERVFHAVCDSDRWDVMKDLLIRKVDPLAVTKTGKSPLVYAVLNTKCRERMVAECSRQGFSLHQPSVTGPQTSLLDDISGTVVGLSGSAMFPCDYIRWKSELTSPLVCAVLCDLPVVALMLYESGACSSAELLSLFTQLPKLIDLKTEEGRTLQEQVIREVETRRARGWSWSADRLVQGYSRLTHTIGQYTPFLKELATTPRTLLSSCRLMISHHFHFSDTERFEKMDLLPLPVPVKQYLEFLDLCDPDYAGHML